MSFEAKAPSDRAATVVTRALELPSAWLERVPERGSAVHDGRLTVRARDSDRVETAPPAPGAVPYEWRPREGMAEVVRVWPPGASVETIRIVAVDGEVVADIAGPVPED